MIRVRTFSVTDLNFEIKQRASRQFFGLSLVAGILSKNRQDQSLTYPQGSIVIHFMNELQFSRVRCSH